MITGIGTPRSHNKIPRPIFTSQKHINAGCNVRRPFRFRSLFRFEHFTNSGRAALPARPRVHPEPGLQWLAFAVIVVGRLGLQRLLGGAFQYHAIIAVTLGVSEGQIRIGHFDVLRAHAEEPAY